jgi:hypothetical protein
VRPVVLWLEVGVCEEQPVQHSNNVILQDIRLARAPSLWEERVSKQDAGRVSLYGVLQNSSVSARQCPHFPLKPLRDARGCGSGGASKSAEEPMTRLGHIIPHYAFDGLGVVY